MYSEEVRVKEKMLRSTVTRRLKAGIVEPEEMAIARNNRSVNTNMHATIEEL
jgi:hypothetical protein